MIRLILACMLVVCTSITSADPKWINVARGVDSSLAVDASTLAIITSGHQPVVVGQFRYTQQATKLNMAASTSVTSCAALEGLLVVSLEGVKTVRLAPWTSTGLTTIDHLGQTLCRYNRERAAQSRFNT